MFTYESLLEFNFKIFFSFQPDDQLLFLHWMLLKLCATQHHLILEIVYYAAHVYRVFMLLVRPHLPGLPYSYYLGNTSLLYLCFELLLCYQCAKLVELHNPGFLFSMMIRLKKLAPTIYFFDMIRKVHIFSLLIATDLISRVQS